MRSSLKRFLSRQNVLATIRKYSKGLLAQEQNHTLHCERPNDYQEYDIGYKNIEYPDGTVRRVQTKKIREPGGRTFYTFGDNTTL